MFCILCVFSYFLVKFKEMVEKENWTLVTQDILNSKSELIVPYTK